MNTKVIPVIATVVAIALVAVGVGYAYTASTTSSNNNASTQYVVMTQTGYSFGTLANDIDTDTIWTDGDADGTLDPGEVVTTYTMHNAAAAITNASGYYGYKLNKDDTLTASYTGASAPTKMGVTLSTSGTFTDYSASPSYWKYILTLKGTTSNDVHYAVFDGKTWNYNNGGTAGSYLILNVGEKYNTELWFGAKSTSASLASSQSIGQTQINNGSITYTGDSTYFGANTVSSVAITTIASMAVNDADQTLTATPTMSSGSNDSAVVWSTSNENIATIVGGKLHAVAAGTVIVTVTIGGVSASQEVTITS